MCPVIRKILQFWHSLRAERQKQPIMEGESSTQAVPEASNHRHSLLHGGCGGPGGVGHGLCSSGPVFFWSIWLSPGICRPRSWAWTWHCSSRASQPSYSNFFKNHYKYFLPLLVNLYSLFPFSPPSLSSPSLPLLPFLSFFNNNMHYFLSVWLWNWFLTPPFINVFITHLL